MSQTSTRIFCKWSSFIFVLIFFSSCSALIKTNKEIESSLESSRTFQKSFTGLAIYDPEEDKMLFEHNANKYFTPASNTKLFTFFTGLKILGDSVPGLKFMQKNDSLIFIGTGDPSLLNLDLPDSKAIEFLSKAEEKLYYVSPIYTEDHFGPGWAWDDYYYAFSSERSAMPVYGNNVVFEFGNDSEYSITPEIFRDSVRIETGSNDPGIIRKPGNNSFQLSKGYKNTSRKLPFKFSERTLIRLLEDTLKKEVSVLKEYPTEEEFHTLYSIPTDSIYKKMLQDSDNFIAEQILLMAAGKISDSLKAKIAIDHMKDNHFQDLPDEPVWVDGSGLSRYNLFSPRTMVKLLEKISKEIPQERLFSLLPAGGESGTLENYYLAERPYIFAKTGTMSNNHSLSGFLKTSSGKILIFSFMNSNYTVPTAEIKKGMEDILKNIRDNY